MQDRVQAMISESTPSTPSMTRVPVDSSGAANAATSR
jgi:hypothetical protein